MVNSRESLKQYCLRSLGEPVIRVNVADEQLEDRIDEAIQYFQTYHYDGIVRTYYQHQLTQSEIDELQISLPDHIYGVKRILPLRDGYTQSNLFDAQYQLRLNDLYEITNTSLVNYTMTMSYISMMDQILNGYPQFDFNYLQGKLYLEMSKTDLVADNYIIIESLSAVDPDTNARFWNDSWLKRYVEALFKKNWATNLKKFSGLQIPGGATIDGKELYLEAIEEIDKLENDLITKATPLGFQVG